MSTLRAGSLRTPILIQYRASGEDEAGQPLDTWVDLGSAWAYFRVQNGLETIKADAQTSITKASARIRFRADVTTAMRVVVRGQFWNVTAVLPDEARRVHVDLVLELRT